MKKTNLLLSAILSIGLLIIFASMGYATSGGNGFYLGIAYGEASLNNDLYIYSDYANARQPALNISQSNNWEGPAYSLYAGYNFPSYAINLFGQKPLLQWGIQAGYTNLGKYTIKVDWSDGPGYRTTTEQALDLLLSGTLLWQNGLNLTGKIGVARLQGRYKDANLPDVVSPDNPFNGEADFAVYRPEIILGAGYRLGSHVNVGLQYAVILGPTPDTSQSRYSDDMLSIDMPDTAYRADRFMLDVSYLF
jgi:hypothetical protein